MTLELESKQVQPHSVGAAERRARDGGAALAELCRFTDASVGLGTAAFTAFIARESSRAFAATQFALFTALAALPRSLANAVTGFIVEEMGWVLFFMLCTLLAIPGMVTLIWVAPWHAEAETADQTSTAGPK